MHKMSISVFRNLHSLHHNFLTLALLASWARFFLFRELFFGIIVVAWSLLNRCYAPHLPPPFLRCDHQLSLGSTVVVVVYVYMVLAKNQRAHLNTEASVVLYNLFVIYSFKTRLRTEWCTQILTEMWPWLKLGKKKNIEWELWMQHFFKILFYAKPV